MAPGHRKDPGNKQISLRLPPRRDSYWMSCPANENMQGGVGTWPVVGGVSQGSVWVCREMVPPPEPFVLRDNTVGFKSLRENEYWA